MTKGTIRLANSWTPAQTNDFDLLGTETEICIRKPSLKDFFFFFLPPHPAFTGLHERSIMKQGELERVSLEAGLWAKPDHPRCWNPAFFSASSSLLKHFSLIPMYHPEKQHLSSWSGSATAHGCDIQPENTYGLDAR